MKRHSIEYFVFLIVLSIWIAPPVYAQDGIKFWIIASGSSSTFMTYGNRVGNTTSGIDSQSVFPLEYREFDAPPPTPSGWDAVWGAVRSNQFGSLSRGLVN